MNTIDLAGLKVHVRGAVESEGPGPLVILLHGFGAPGTDLVSLADEIAAPPGTRFLFPEGKLDLAMGQPGYAGARAWWPIDVMRVQMAMMAGATEDVARYLLPGLEDAEKCVAALVDEVGERFGVGSNRIVLGGFSQGAILSLETTLVRQFRFAGLLLFSGSLLDREHLSKRAATLTRTACVVSHGQVDPILPFSLGEALQNTLASAGWDVDWVPFLGGHGIPPKALAAAGRLVTRQFA